jgi:hypothetical protein
LEGLHFRSDPETSPSDLQCPDLYFWRVSEHLEASFSRAELSRVLVIQWGAPFSGGFQIYIVQRLRGILEIRAPGLFLPSPDLLFGIFLEVIGHLWHQGRIVEELQLSNRAWHLPAVRGLALGIGLHLLSSVWRLILYCREHFVAAHTCYLLSIILAIC